ncbi:exo-alpha-sialidase [Fodinisporobacter ferrooxydans]|uniref:Exo-alpha-sialidase n=1 Tax=Fodinisporobacter ferrooxydans TaxID=2901836 RepID=A0ABY4CPX6_9BACL|nr:exo-alpha-sialidase [Alicyclobacillaceae bacterium MYW30-H2]
MKKNLLLNKITIISIIVMLLQLLLNRLQNGQIWQGLTEETLWENNLTKIFEWDGIIQPTLWESLPGHIHMLLRSTRGKIFRSDSKDYGQTWCMAYPTDLPNNNSGIDVVKLKNGRLALVYNPITGNWSSRTPISISYSSDNGLNWTEPYHLETQEGEFSYPAIISDEDDIHITYTYNRKNIMYQHICELVWR